jgi:hypothetical protein
MAALRTWEDLGRNAVTPSTVVLSDSGMQSFISSRATSAGGTPMANQMAVHVSSRVSPPPAATDAWLAGQLDPEASGETGTACGLAPGSGSKRRVSKPASRAERIIRQFYSRRLHGAEKRYVRGRYDRTSASTVGIRYGAGRRQGRVCTLPCATGARVILFISSSVPAMLHQMRSSPLLRWALAGLARRICPPVHALQCNHSLNSRPLLCLCLQVGEDTDEAPAAKRLHGQDQNEQHAS